VDVRPLTPDRLDDLARLFGTSGVSTGCWCMWFMLTSREFQAGWRGANRARFEEYARASAEPLGLLAYTDTAGSPEAAGNQGTAERPDPPGTAGVPVGWCATGPRARYGRMLRSPLLRGRHPDEDAGVWLVACLYVRRDARHTGITHGLIEAAVRLAHEHGATAIEAVPLAGGPRHPTSEAYVGTEAMFSGCGFDVRARPSPRRLVMRRELTD
jgi:GNAT superfamily N-acetyltransferase